MKTERMIIKNNQTGEFSCCTNLEDIHQMCLDDHLCGFDGKERDYVVEAHWHYSAEQKRMFVENEYHYVLLKPTAHTIADWEECHDDYWG